MSLTPQKESKRITKLRQGIAKAIPKVPNKKETLDELLEMNITSLLVHYLTWRGRFVFPKPREVKLWGSEAEKAVFTQHDQQLKPLFAKVKAGDDLTSHLSNSVRKTGFKSRKVNNTGNTRWEDKDFMLIAYGLYHLHIGNSTDNNPTGRSNILIIADITDTDFTVIAITNHDVFLNSSVEREKFYELSTAYIQRDMVPGAVYMRSPIMSSGHSASISFYAMYCTRIINEVDPKLDDKEYIRSFYKNTDRQMPTKPSFMWGFIEMNLGVFETKSNMFFRITTYNR